MADKRVHAPDNCDGASRWQTMSTAELEHEYSPSTAVGGNYQPFIEEYSARSTASRTRCAHIRTLRYGDRTANLIDCVPAKKPSNEPDVPSPLLVFIHGGYWQEGSRTDSLFGADYFVEQGIAYAAIGYSLAPQATLPEIVTECRQAIACLQSHAVSLCIDASKIVIAGSSAGAQLAAMCCVSDTTFNASAPTPVAGLILLSGIFDLEPLVSTYVNDEVGMSLQDARHLSPMHNSLSAFPDTIISWGENETDEFKRQSRAFAKTLRRADVEVAEFESSGRNHFNIVHDLADKHSELGYHTLSMLNK